MYLLRARWWYPVVPAAALRLFGLGSQSYWTDEAITVQTATWSWAKMLAYWQVDPHPPLHYLLIRLLVLLGGSGEGWLRLSSAAAGIGAVLLVCAALQRAFDDRTALVGGLLAALNPALIWASQDLRGSAPAGLFLALTFYGVQRMEKSDGRHGYRMAALGLTLAFYTHYYALLAAPLLLFGSRHVRRVTLLALLAFAPWFLFLISQTAAAAQFRAVSPWWRNLVETLLYANAGHFPWHWPTWIGTLDGLLQRHFALYLALALALVAPVFALAFSSGRRGLALARWYLIPALLAWLTGLVLPSFSPKYLAPFLPFLAAAAGVGFVKLHKRRVRLSYVLLLAALCVPAASLFDLYTNPAFQKTPWRKELPRLVAALNEQDLIVFYSATEATDARYYLPHRAQIIDLLPDYAAYASASPEVIAAELDRLAARRSAQVVLVDLNGALYDRLRQSLLEVLGNTRKKLVDAELQPAMGVRWIMWGRGPNPCLSCSETPTAPASPQTAQSPATD